MALLNFGGAWGDISNLLIDYSLGVVVGLITPLNIHNLTLLPVRNVVVLRGYKALPLF